MLPKEFKPANEYKLIRLGSDNDGGYLVEDSSIKKSKALVTLGLGYDWSFEKAYSQLTRNSIFCYDHTISYSRIKKYCRSIFLSLIFRALKPKFFLKKNFFKDNFNRLFLFNDYKKFFIDNKQHIQSRIGTGKSGVKLNDILDSKIQEFPIFLKVDIEGSEYRILNEILQNQDKFTGIAIEFHDVDLHLNTITNFIKNLKLKLVHIHPQNPAFVADNNIPTQIELTFAKNPEIVNQEPRIPHTLDQRANPDFKEIELFFSN